MEVEFVTPKLAKLMNDDGKLAQKYGPECARKIRARLDDLAAAENLEAMRELPGRCEELKGDRKGELSIRLAGAQRLVFVPDHETIPTKDDGGLDWPAVTSITVTEVVDYH